MLRSARERLGEQLQIDWKYFPLEQVNSTHGEDWKLWEQPESYPSRSRLAWKGAEAARKQGRDAFERFNVALLTARHADGRELTDQQTIFDAAAQAGLDREQFRRDFESADLTALGPDYEEGREEYGVFGTPTFLFEGAKPAYLKLRPLPPDEELFDVYQQVKALMVERPNIQEIKRPVPPAK